MSALYVCATPIGNLFDASLRLIETLKNVDLIVAEDTRQTKKLLERYSIQKDIISYNEHNKKQKNSLVLEQILSGKNVALVSDAGTPTISDPGFDLVKSCVQEGIQIIPIPGPCAFIAALSVSGISADRFVFEGFLPREGKMRRRVLRKLANEERTIVFYEAPHRLLKTLNDILKIFGDRRICIAREITKIYEELYRGKISEAISKYEQGVLGEITLIIEGYISS